MRRLSLSKDLNSEQKVIGYESVPVPLGGEGKIGGPNNSLFVVEVWVSLRYSHTPGVEPGIFVGGWVGSPAGISIDNPCGEIHLNQVNLESKMSLSWQLSEFRGEFVKSITDVVQCENWGDVDEVVRRLIGNLGDDDA